MTIKTCILVYGGIGGTFFFAEFPDTGRGSGVQWRRDVVPAINRLTEKLGMGKVWYCEGGTPQGLTRQQWRKEGRYRFGLYVLAGKDFEKEAQ